MTNRFGFFSNTLDLPFRFGLKPQFQTLNLTF